MFLPIALPMPFMYSTVDLKKERIYRKTKKQMIVVMAIATTLVNNKQSQHT